jgi:hypothetical protein
MRIGGLKDRLFLFAQKIFCNACKVRLSHPTNAQEEHIMQRRQFLYALSGLSLAYVTRSFAAPSTSVSIVQFSDAGKPLGRVTLPKVNKDAEWKKTLSPLAYNVTREQGTERAFSQKGYDRHEPGLYRCVCCDNALFDAKTKYETYRSLECAQHRRSSVRHEAHRSALRPVRRASRSCVRRRPQTHRFALLHEYGGDAVYSIC